jgi:hypothetical protein
MQGKQEWVISGQVANSWTGSRVANILDYTKTLLYIENVGKTSGVGSGAIYSVEASANRDDSIINWYTLISGVQINSGESRVHKILGDPWDSVRFKTISAGSGYEPDVKAYINRSP